MYLQIHVATKCISIAYINNQLQIIKYTSRISNLQNFLVRFYILAEKDARKLASAEAAPEANRRQ